MRWLLPLIWAGIICYLSLMPGNELPDFDLFHLLFIDKWVHVFFYFVFAFLLFFSWKTNHSLIFKSIFILILCFLFGTGIEIIQETYTDTRHFEWMDLLFDIIGAASYIFIWLKKQANYFVEKEKTPE